MSTGVARNNRAKQEERRGEIRYGRKGRGAERDGGRRLADRLVGQGEKTGEKKQKKEGGGKERSGSLRHDL